VKKYQSNNNYENVVFLMGAPPCVILRH